MMILFNRWTFLLLVSFLTFSSCSSDSSGSDDLRGNWVSRFSFNGPARSEAVSFTIGNKSYVGGGFDGLVRLKDFWEYDGVTGLWRRVADMPGDARSGAFGFGVNGKGYVGTGFNDSGIRLKDFYEYTPAEGGPGTWTQLQDFEGSARQDATSFSFGSKGYVISGYDGSYLKDFWEYDPTSDSWEEKPFPGNKRREALAFIINNKVYFGTGINNGLVVNDFWEFDPATSNWVQKRAIQNISDESYDDEYTTIMRSNSAAFVLNGKGYITTGESGANINECWEYDPATDLWERKTPFESVARTGSLGLTVNGKGIIMTGRNGSNPFDDVWEFFPDAEQVDND